MKKKLALLCMAGIMAAGISACGGSKSGDGAQEAAQASETAEAGTAAGEEHTDSGDGTEAAGDGEDHAGIQDLDIGQYVTLADYRSMKVSAVKPAVDDQTVTEYIDRELLVGMFTDRAVQDGDVVDIDFEGRKDGVAFQGGTAEGYRLAIGSGSFIPGFEDGLVGVMPGETVDLNLTFPEDYKQNADLAGQEVVFTVTVNGIEGSAEYATVTPEDMEKLGLSYKTKEEVWEAGKKDVEKNAEEAFEANARSEVLRRLVAESDIQSVPEYLVEEEAQNYRLYIEAFSQAVYGMDADSFIRVMYGVTPEEFDDQMNASYTENVKIYMVLEAVARAEDLGITEEMIREEADAEAAGYGYASGEELTDRVGFTAYRMSVVQDKVMERLMEIVTVEEEEAQETAEP